LFFIFFSFLSSFIIATLRSAKDKAAYFKTAIQDRLQENLGRFYPFYIPSRILDIRLIVEVTGDKTATMQWVEYEKNMVQKGICLVGWTHPKWGSPSTLGGNLKNLETLFNAVNSRTCRFVKGLTDDEKKKHSKEWTRKVRNGDLIPPRSRAKAKDSGNPRKRQRIQSSSSEGEDGEDDEDGEDGGSGDDE
jgi:hypothetical protein